MYVGLHVKYPLFLSDFIETWIFRQIFEEYSNINFGENPSGGRRAVWCGRAGGRRTDMTKPVVCLRNFANAPKMRMEAVVRCCCWLAWRKPRKPHFPSVGVFKPRFESVILSWVLSGICWTTEESNPVSRVSQHGELGAREISLHIVHTSHETRQLSGQWALGTIYGG